MAGRSLLWVQLWDKHLLDASPARQTCDSLWQRQPLTPDPWTLIFKGQCRETRGAWNAFCHKKETEGGMLLSHTRLSCRTWVVSLCTSALSCVQTIPVRDRANKQHLEGPPRVKGGYTRVLKWLSYFLLKSSASNLLLTLPSWNQEIA